jgi:hypothetical protein
MNSCDQSEEGLEDGRTNPQVPGVEIEAIVIDISLCELFFEVPLQEVLRRVVLDCMRLCLARIARLCHSIEIKLTMNSRLPISC